MAGGVGGQRSYLGAMLGQKLLLHSLAALPLLG